MSPWPWSVVGYWLGDRMQAALPLKAHRHLRVLCAPWLNCPHPILLSCHFLGCAEAWDVAVRVPCCLSVTLGCLFPWLGPTATAVPNGEACHVTRVAYKRTCGVGLSQRPGLRPCSPCSYGLEGPRGGPRGPGTVGPSQRGRCCTQGRGAMLVLHCAWLGLLSEDPGGEAGGGPQPYDRLVLPVSALCLACVWQLHK